MHTWFDPTSPDPIDIYRPTHTPNPVAKQQTRRILPELRTEEECFSREILAWCVFEGGGEYYPRDAKQYKGK